MVLTIGPEPSILTTSRTAALARARPPTIEAAPERAYFPALDGLRAIAFLMVFGQHYLKLPWGWAGVDVFFVLSGFLITGILFDTRDEEHRVRDFYVRRTLRIFPLYYGAIFLLVLSYPIFRWEWSWSWLLWPAYLGNFLHGIHLTDGTSLKMLAEAQLVSLSFPRVQLLFGHFWSLCVEEQFYLIWPWVVFGVRDRRKLLWICMACVAACPLLRVLATHTLPHYLLEQEVLYRFTPFRVDALLLGGALALVRRGSSARILLVAARIGFAAISSAVLLWLALALVPGHTHRGYAFPPWRFTWGLSVIDLLAACAIVMALEFGSTTSRILSLSPLRWLGRISYGAYVFHAIPYVLFGHLAGRYTSHPRVATAVMGFCSTLLLAWASFRWFERPFIRLKRRWAPTPVEELRRAVQSELVTRVA
jgi:peptidoglycan/LPS O-acetylase OafA/YrhL